MDHSGPVNDSLHTFQVVNEPADMQCPIVEMSTRSKLSCLSWNKHEKNHIASSDYEGIVTVWDVTTRQVSTLPGIVSFRYSSHELCNVSKILCKQLVAESYGV